MAQLSFDDDVFPAGLISAVLPASNWGREFGRQIKTLIVLHSAETAERADTAEGVAAWFAGQRGAAPETSAHFCVDANSVVQCVPTAGIAWHARGANRESIGLELAGKASQTRAQWLDPYGVAMLTLAARLTAALCQRYGIPARFLAAAELRAERSLGITTHAEVSLAWGKSSHTDPGRGFPMDWFVAAVLAASALAGRETLLHARRSGA